MHEDSTYMLTRGDLDLDDALAIGFYTVRVSDYDWAYDLASGYPSMKRLNDRQFCTMFVCISCQVPVHVGYVRFS